MVAKAPVVVGVLLVSMRVAFSAVEVMCLGLHKRQQPKMRCSFRGSKACLVSDWEAVLYGWMSGISVRCILAMPDGYTEYNFGGVAKRAGLGCLEGGIDKGEGLGSLVGC